ncbi:MAG: FAD-dependent oxidoreductase, partial [Bacteroidia bacterium]|nr:FAD-dependent oxidoreductase [Bacteroidia bacterium]
MKKKVIIIGGGVAGMSAAHELANRNYDVEIYESTGTSGGKARSTVVVPPGFPSTTKPVPGEHGFRFFPRFYKHITTTMAEIPLGNGKTVADNLTETTEIKLARFGKESVKMSARFPRSLNELEEIIQNASNTHLGLTEQDKKDFALKVWQLITSCRDRRRNEYERLGWWEFLDADQHSEIYQTVFVRGLTRTLVAARAETASTKTGGNIFLQLIFDITTPGISSDRILNGPTNDVWIDPWKKYLTEQKNVKIFYDHPAVNVGMSGQKISNITLRHKGIDKPVTADHYILATPVEVTAKLLNKELI